MGDWQQRWDEGRLGFHRDDVHPDLEAYESQFLSGRHRVFVPLCGKSVDMVWLAERGHEVFGVELVRKAVEDFFTEQGLSPTVEEVDGLPVYRAGHISLAQGDIFALEAGHTGRFDRIWDRAALVALPRDVRSSYTAQIKRLAQPGAKLLQNAFEYDQSVMEGPPFSVPDDEVRDHYRDQHIELLDERDAIEMVPQFRARGHEYWLVRSYLITMAR